MKKERARQTKRKKAQNKEKELKELENVITRVSQFLSTEPTETEIERFKKHLKKMKEKVAYILAKYPHTRNDDLYLWIMLIREFYPEFSKFIKYIPFEMFKKAPSYETVRRVRAKIQNELHKFLPTDPKVLKKRRKMEKIWRKAITQI